MSFAEKEKLRCYQYERCAICGVPEKELTRKLHTDHNHETGKIRGLLCANCNHGIGNFKDNIRLLFLAVEYLEKAGQK